MTHSFAGYRQGCRCDTCKLANRENSRRWRERKYAARGEGPKQRNPSPPHGSRSRYIKGCRCEPCTEANTLGSRAWRAKPLSERFVSHGRGGYSSGCRCPLCTLEHRNYMREYMRTYRANRAVTKEAEHGQEVQTSG